MTDAPLFDEMAATLRRARMWWEDGQHDLAVFVLRRLAADIAADADRAALAKQ